MDTEKKYTQDEIDALGNKYNRIIGVGIIAVAILIISINMCCRFAGAIKSRHYEYTDGIVIKKEEYKLYPFGANGRPNYNYEIKVEYVPEGESRTYTFWDYSHAYEFIDKGDTLRIYYMEDDPEESYAAQRDWLTRMYLPAENSYNIPLVIAAVLIIIGIYFFIDDNKTKVKKKMI